MLQLRSKETLDHGHRGLLKARHHFKVLAERTGGAAAILTPTHANA
jgi:hypothetical protein